MKFKILWTIIIGLFIVTNLRLDFLEDKIENMESNVDTILNANISEKGESSLEESLQNANDTLSDVLNRIRNIFKVYGDSITIIITGLGWFLFFVFKAIKFRSGQKSALFFGILAPVFYICITYLSAFLSMVK